MLCRGIFNSKGKVDSVDTNYTIFEALVLTIIEGTMIFRPRAGAPALYGDPEVTVIGIGRCCFN